MKAIWRAAGEKKQWWSAFLFFRFPFPLFFWYIQSFNIFELWLHFEFRNHYFTFAFLPSRDLIGQSDDIIKSTNAHVQAHSPKWPTDDWNIKFEMMVIRLQVSKINLVLFFSRWIKFSHFCGRPICGLYAGYLAVVHNYFCFNCLHPGNVRFIYLVLIWIWEITITKTIQFNERI